MWPMLRSPGRGGPRLGDSWDGMPGVLAKRLLPSGQTQSCRHPDADPRTGDGAAVPSELDVGRPDGQWMENAVVDRPGMAAGASDFDGTGGVLPADHLGTSAQWQPVSRQKKEFCPSGPGPNGQNRLLLRSFRLGGPAAAAGKCPCFPPVTLDGQSVPDVSRINGRPTLLCWMEGRATSPRSMCSMN